VKRFSTAFQSLTGFVGGFGGRVMLIVTWLLSHPGVQFPFNQQAVSQLE
jgi:hypothetical protein